MHLAFLIKFMSLTYIAISVSLGSLYKSHVAANCGVKVCSTFVTVTEPACMQCCMRSLSAAVLVRRYARCLRPQHGGVPARLRPRDDLRRLLAAAAEAIHPWSDGVRPAQAAPGQVPAVSPHVVALSLSPEPGGGAGRRHADAAQARRRAAFHAMKLFDALAERLPSAERGARAASASAPRLSAARHPFAKQ